MNKTVQDYEREMNRPKVSVQSRVESTFDSEASAMLFAVEQLKNPAVESVSISFTKDGHHQYLNLRTDNFMTVSRHKVGA